MNELQIIVNQEPGVISTNFEDIKAELSARMEVYKEMEVTEENKPERKKDIATLRKMIKAVNERRIDIKNRFLVPYTEFEQKVKELVEIINEPIGILDSQVKEFEDKQRLQKIENINTAFCEIMEGYPTLCNDIGIIEIYDNRWENATASMKSIRDEMTAKLNTIRDNVALISSMVSDKTEEALRLFWGDLDVAKAMQMINKYEAQKREIQARLEEQQRKEREAEEERQRLARERELERERQRVRDEELARIRKEEQIRYEERVKVAEAEEKIREEERQKILAEQEAKERAELEATKIQRQQDEAETISETYIVNGTSKEIEQLEMYMDSIGVSYQKF